MRKKEMSDKKKEIAAALALLAVMYLIIGGILSLIGYVLLELIGFTYESKRWVVFFFALYLLLGLPISAITEGAVKAFGSLGYLKGIWYRVIDCISNIGAEILLICLIDSLLSGIFVPFLSVVFFAVLMYLLEQIFNSVEQISEERNGEKGRRQ